MHRDLNPKNVFIQKIGSSEFAIKIGDFGIAREVDHNSPENHTPGIGTFYYNSPERIMKKEYD